MQQDIEQIGTTYQQLRSNGVSDIKEIAHKYYEQESKLKRLQYLTYERYLKHSNQVRAEICEQDGISSKECLVWATNHYLGLNRHPYVIEKTKEAIEKYGTGCGTSAMSGGHSQLHKDIQYRFAKIFAKERALLFPTGFTVNLGVITAICRDSSSLILIDKESHASIVEGCKASRVKYMSFKHNSVVDLEKKLNKYSSKYTNILVVVESAYSMAGDTAPLQEIAALKNKYNFLLFVDEANTFGIYGKNGRGFCHELGVTDQVDFITTTLSKATCSIGGIVATSKEFAALLKFSSSYLFQASIPPADVAAANACIDLMYSQPEIIDALWQKTHYARSKFLDSGFDLGTSNGPIIPIYIRVPSILKAMEKELYENGIFTIAVQFPVVSAIEGRFRIVINNNHTYDDIDKLINILLNLANKHNVSLDNK